MMRTVSAVIAAALRQAGIEIVYGLPGGASLPLLAALRQAGLQFVLVRNESTAVYMAEVSARLTGKPGVCIVTLGPGAANAYAGVANAWLDRSPVLIFTADFPEALKAAHTHQVLDLEAMFTPVTKWTTAVSGENVAQVMPQALMLARHGRPGPVHLRLSGQAAEESVITPMLQSQQPTETPLPDMTTARRIVAQSKRPLIVAGLGLEPERPYLQLRQLAEKLKAPLIDTPKSKGCLPASHPLFGGTIGLTHTDPAYEILAEADCVLAVGFDVVELVKPWQHQAPLIWVSNWTNADPQIEAVTELVGSLPAILTKLLAADCQPEAAWGEPRVSRFRERLRAVPLPRPAPGRMLPQEVLTAVRHNIPPETLLATDVGSHKILAALAWPVEVPNRYMVSNGLSAMGFGLPAAIAANFVLNEPTVCLHGDGGFQMVMGECGILTETGRPVICVVLHDAALDLIRAKQLRRAETPFGTEFVNPHFGEIARAYQLDYYLVADVAGCATAVRQALAKKRPALIEALIDPVGYPTAPPP